MKKFLRSMTLLLMLCLCVSVMAEPQRYKVELIVFSHSDPTALNSENWPIIINPENYESRGLILNPIRDDINSSIALTNYILLSNSHFSLNRIGNTLAHTNGYKVMLHIAWYQPINESSKWIHIFGGIGYTDDGKPILENSDGDAHYNQAAHWQVDGLLQLSRQHYINSSYHFMFAAPTRQIKELSTTGNFAKVDAPLVYFKLSESRRMRSDELNYINHPLYGILINITQPSNSTHPQE